MSRRSGKPYDPPSSFMQKMTRRVSAYIPKKITSWLSSTNEEQNGPEQPHIETPSNSAPPTVQIPPAKRLKTDLNAVVPHTVPFPCTINYPIDDASSSSDFTSRCSSRVPQEILLNDDPVEASVNSSPKGSQLYGLLFDPNTLNHTVEPSKVTPQLPAKSRKLAFDASLARSPLISNDCRVDVTRSPFYPGKTCYGGASAYRRSFGASPRALNTSLDLNSSTNSVDSPFQGSPHFRLRGRGLLANSFQSQITPSPSTKAVTERILKAVESVTPSGQSAQSSTLKRRFMEYESPQQNGHTGPPIRSLNAPTVRDLMQQKVSVARTMTLPKSKPAWKESSYTLRQEDQSTSAKYSSKAKRNEELSELPEPVSLPQISLQMNSLPTFDFAPLPIKPAASDLASFTFSAPIDVKAQTMAPRPTPIYNYAPKPVVVSKPKEVEKMTAPVEVKKGSPAGFGDMFKKPAGSWSCSACMVTNKSEHSACVACGQNNTTSVPSTTSQPATQKPATFQGFGNMFKKPAGSWDCSSCMLSNKPDAEKCAACETKKPSAAPVQSLGSMFKKPEGNWECPTCMVNNKADAAKCVACTQPNPSAPKEKTSLAPAVTFTPAVSIAPSFGTAFKKAAGSWECTVCMINNNAEASKCAACETARDGVDTPKPVVASSFNGFGDKFKKTADKWSCPVCMVNNSQDLAKCQACQYENPSNQKIKTSVEENKPKFSFGLPPKDANTNKELFSFGAPKDKKSDTAPGKGFVFGDGAPKVDTKPFTFGVSSAAKAETAASPPATLPAPLMMINPPSSTAPKLKRKAPEDNIQFSSSKLSFSPKTDSAPTLAFKPAVELKQTPVEPPKAPEPIANKNPSFSFMNEDEEDKAKKPSASVQSLFGPVTNNPLFSFPSTTTKEAEKAKPEAQPSQLFQFGQPAKEGFASLAFSPVVPAKDSTPAPAFELKPAATVAKPLELFSAAASSPAPFSFSSAPNNPPAFKLGAATLPFQTEQKEAAPSAGFFKPVEKAPVFGQPQSFSQVASEEAQSSFALTKPGGFSFNSQPPANNFFAFGPKPGPPAPAFAAKPATAFGLPGLNAGPPPAFGDLKSSGGFNFTANAPNVLQPLQQTNANAAPGGFNFNATVPKFNPDIRPTFNFTNNSSAVTSFNATNMSTPNATAAMQGRKIRKATRRMQPR